MKTQTRAVVIGGGIVGCSILYHLAKHGWTDVMLLEKGELTSGTTFHSVGLVTQFRTSPTVMQMQNYSIQLYNELKADVGAVLGWNQVGSLRLASSPDRLRELQRNVSRAKALGLDVAIISPQEAVDIFPRMSDRALHGAVYIPDDGWLEPNGISLELARRARQMGATVHTNVRVTGFEVSPQGEVKRVLTEHGAIDTEVVVNAAGMWASQLGAMVGVHLPIVPLMHQYVITRPIPGHELPRQTPVIRDPDNLVYIREEVGGYLVGGFEAVPKAWSTEGVPWEYTQRLLPPEWELFYDLMEGAIRRVPEIERAEIVRLVNGPEAITPDGFYALGPTPGLRGYYVAAGMSLNGIAGAGGVGKVMAEWICEGEPSLDLHEMDVRRFGPQFRDRQFTVERTREVYKYYYHMHYPEDEWEWGRPLRTSALYERLKEFGAVFGEKAGWERVSYFDPGRPWRQAGAEQHRWGWGRPPYFEQVGAEHRAARERAALFDMSSFSKIEVSGPGALALLQHLADNDLDKPVGAVTYTQFLNNRGGIESDLTITRRGAERFWIVTGTAFGANDMNWIRLHLPDDGSVSLTDITEEWACIGLWGPRARDVLGSITEDEVSNAAFPYMTARAITVNGEPVWAQRVSYVGELGWELYVRPEPAVALWDALVEAGRPFGLMPAGYKALESLRLEKSYRYWSADITPSENPYESGQGFCVKLGKGDFIGRAALLRVREEGVRRRLCGLVLADDACVLYGGEAVHSGGSVIGRVRSGGYGYTLGQNIAYAYLPVDLSQPGTEVAVEVFGERVPATVARQPLYDGRGEKLRG